MTKKWDHKRLKMKQTNPSSTQILHTFNKKKKNQKIENITS